MIDAGLGPALLEFLTQCRITTVDTVLISHADQDHIGGLLGLLGHRDIEVKRILLNPDAAKRTKIWQALRFAVEERRKNRELQVETQLTLSSSISLSCDEVQIEVLAPAPEITMSGAGGIDLAGRLLTSNSMSAVVKFSVNDSAEVLLFGDLDEVGLDNLLRDHPEPKARVLVFPHHGGHSGGNNDFQFAKMLCDAVQPSLVVFSIGRGKYATPRPAIVQGVRASVPTAHIACTQLSANCAASLPTISPSHLADWYAQGRVANKCCAGTVNIALGDQSLTYQPDLQRHRKFVTDWASDALCIRQDPTTFGNLAGRRSPSPQ